ncbi:site-specific DNA-methyltransferase [Kribbella turkmenica]|uniref:Methyltransferase n=1 Tax=Kribbella turkmenica TaxID=2530375 RepID=A0A4R4XCD3_9ACTN|nr:site-specific DNA-methyltransferase [Kribbella turkmenica]TDD28358.1 site-specific DNA-methyltransferase [Kribbella turkmenica]
MTQAPRNTILVGDALDQLRQLPSESVDMVLTSPPYYNLRNYQVGGQLGQESNIQEWVSNLTAVAAEVRRVLTPSGTFWLNVADRYSIHDREGSPRKSLLLGPARLSTALAADGWLVRNQIIWSKTNPMPSSVPDRLTSTYEVVYLLAKQRSYFFDLDAIRVPHTSNATTPQASAKDSIPRQWRARSTDNVRGLVSLKQRGIVGHPLGKNPGDVWQLPTSSYRGAHFATFPERLAERAILAGSPEARCSNCFTPHRRVTRRLGATAIRGTLLATCTCDAPSESAIVLDPFMGAGTTAVAAEKHGRNWLGIELNPDFAALADDRIRTARGTPEDRAA